MFRMRAVWFGMCWISLSILAGCATPPVSDRQVKSVDAMSALNRSGRFAMKADTFGRPPEAVQGGFVWSDRGQVLTLDLTNPLGAVLARVEVGPHGALLRDSSGNITRAPHPDALIKQVIGQEMPVSGLRSWMRGLSAPGSPADEVVRTAGQLARLRQHGWLIELSRYDTRGPRLLVLTRQDGERTITLRLVIDQS